MKQCKLLSLRVLLCFCGRNPTSACLNSDLCWAWPRTGPSGSINYAFCFIKWSVIIMSEFDVLSRNALLIMLGRSGVFVRTLRCPVKKQGPSFIPVLLLLPWTSTQTRLSLIQLEETFFVKQLVFILLVTHHYRSLPNLQPSQFLHRYCRQLRLFNVSLAQTTVWDPFGKGTARNNLPWSVALWPSSLLVLFCLAAGRGIVVSTQILQSRWRREHIIILSVSYTAHANKGRPLGCYFREGGDVDVIIEAYRRWDLIGGGGGVQFPLAKLWGPGVSV